MIDLHVHTSASDGQYTAEEIVHKAAEKNISVLGITDHDTIGGLEMGKKAAKECGITLVPGVELSINFPTGEFHLLGLGLKRVSPGFQQILDNVVENRHRRNCEIIDKMRADGVDITIEEMYQEFPNTILGRPHFAAMLQKKGIVRHRQQAFDRLMKQLLLSASRVGRLLSRIRCRSFCPGESCRTRLRIFMSEVLWGWKHIILVPSLRNV